MRFQCNYCKSVLDIEDVEPGELVICGSCDATVAVPATATSPGSMLGDFAIVRELGSGGMGAVYLAHQVTLDRPVALKILNEGFSADDKFIENFISEARTAAALNHPNIVQAFAVNCDKGYYYFAMELVEGNTMKQTLQNSGRFVAEKVLTIAADVITALGYAWQEKKLIHRDIKPDNIMLTNDGRTKLADLGLARRVSETGEDGSTELYGTPQYIAPELLLGAPADIRSDIYSLGATMYQAFTGAYPFQAEDVNSMALEHLYTPLPGIREIYADIPEGAARLIEIMMAKRPGHRYQNYHDLLLDLELVRKGQIPRKQLAAEAQRPINTDLPLDKALSVKEEDLSSSEAMQDKERLQASKTVKKGRMLIIPKKGVSLKASDDKAALSALEKQPASAIRTDAAKQGAEITTDAEASSAKSSKKGKIVFAVLALIIVAAGIGLALTFSKKDSKSEAIDNEVGEIANSSLLENAKAKLAGLTETEDKLNYLQGLAKQIDNSHPEYAEFIALAAPYIEEKLPELRKEQKEASEASWEAQRAEVLAEEARQAEQERVRQEREEKERLAKLEKERLEQELADKLAAAEKRRNEMLAQMIHYAEVLDFSAARGIFAVMAEAGETEEDRDWAAMLQASIADAEELYALLRNSREKLAGFVFQLLDEERRNITRDWELVTIQYDTIRLRRKPTRRELEDKNPEPMPEKTFEINAISLKYFKELSAKILELEGRQNDYSGLLGNYLLIRANPEAERLLNDAMARSQLLQEIPKIKNAYLQTRLEALKSMSRNEKRREIANLRKSYPQEFAAMREEFEAAYRE